jgi:hypothetical protein
MLFSGSLSFVIAVTELWSVKATRRRTLPQDGYRSSSHKVTVSSVLPTGREDSNTAYVSQFFTASHVWEPCQYNSEEQC